MTMPELLAFTRMTGDLVKAMRACPQPIIAAVDGVCAGAGAILALASDLRLGTARSKTAFLFTRVGLAGCDMGACAHAAAHDRPGPRRRTALHRPRDDGAEGRALGLLQPPARAARPCSARPQALARGAGRRPDLRPRHDQEDAAPGMGHGRRRSRSKPRRRRRRSAWRPAISAAPTTPSSPSRSRNSKATEMAADHHAHLALAVLRRRATRTRDASSMPGPRGTLTRRRHGATSMRPAARWCAGWATAGWLRHAFRRAHGGARRRIDSRAICLIRETLALPRRPGRFRLRHAGAGHRRDQPCRHAEQQQARYLPRVARGEAIAAFALSEPEAGSDVAAMPCAARARRRRLRPRRREDLDLQRRHRRLLRRVRAHRRSAGRARHQAFVVVADDARLRRSPSAST